MDPIRGLYWRGRPVGRANLARLLVVLIAASGLLMVTGSQPVTGADPVCGRNYVAGGDHIPAGHEVSESERYPEQLIEQHAAAYGFCVFNLAEDGTTSATYISGGQLATTWNRQADLITLTVGGENGSIINLIDSCFDKVRDHDFLGANICAAGVLANVNAWNQLKSDLTTTLQQYRMIMAGRPQLVVAVTGYANPYPDPIKAGINIPLLCIPLIDTIPTCTIRWLQLPPALVLLDYSIKFLNATIQGAVRPFQLGPSGNRFVFVNPYSTFRDHCMEMKVKIKTEVEHPEQSGAVHKHESPEVNFGCSDPWFVKGDDGTAMPIYLIPAAPGILINMSQTTKGMGIHPNADGHECLAHLIWEADTIDPGTSPLKWKLGVPEAPDTTPCD
jgi:hypothetical protein